MLGRRENDGPRGRMKGSKGDVEGGWGGQEGCDRTGGLGRVSEEW